MAGLELEQVYVLYLGLEQGQSHCRAGGIVSGSGEEGKEGEKKLQWDRGCRQKEG